MCLQTDEMKNENPYERAATRNKRLRKKKRMPVLKDAETMLMKVRHFLFLSGTEESPAVRQTTKSAVPMSDHLVEQPTETGTQTHNRGQKRTEKKRRNILFLNMTRFKHVF